jgi:hypothetical protein
MGIHDVVQRGRRLPDHGPAETGEAFDLVDEGARGGWSEVVGGGPGRWTAQHADVDLGVFAQAKG